MPSAFEYTLRQLDDHGIARCGAGDDLKAATQPAVIVENGVEHVLLYFGWDVINCRYASESSAGVSPLELSNVLDAVRTCRERYPRARIVVLPHWDYELERWPMPMHRQLSKKAIEAGADAVIGHHPHCLQGYETFHGKPVFYSLGNWFFTDSVYMDGKTKFPSYAHRETALEWGVDEFVCHWFDFDPARQRLVYEKSEYASDASELTALSPFRGMSDDDYEKWFRTHRVKSKGLPVFKSYESPSINSMKKKVVMLRGECLSLLWKSGLRQHRSGMK